MFGHCVYFSLKDATEPAVQALIAGCHQYLAGHDGLVFYAAGILADTQRDVNDRDYQVALHTVFCNRAAHDAYQDSPQHMQFIETFRENWARVRVFDNVLTAE